jgi:glycosyltransferase involved in cell wall biosynthesis
MKTFTMGAIRAYLLLFTIWMPTLTLSNYDVTIGARLLFADGIGRVPIAIIDMLKDDLRINFISTSGNNINLKDVPLTVQKVLLEHSNTTAGTVALMCSGLWYKHTQPIQFLPNSKIKIAYSMFETNKIPNQWVEILNKQFDAVVVPDPFLIKVYKNSGVAIPIFMIPCGLYLEEFLKQPLKERKNKKFVFGMTGGFGQGKNHKMLINAFATEFGNTKNVSLLIHGRSTGGKYVDSLKQAIKTLKVKNIKLINRAFTQKELFNFMASLDCYALVSKGEGFSITPREALALGIPCILSNNTSHQTLCNTGLVKGVPCPILEPADYSQVGLGGIDCGQQFNCKQEDVQKALREVYNNYALYLGKAKQGREWVKQYDYKNLRKRYLNLIKPQNIIFGDRNEITDDYFMTNSPLLYRKYNQVFGRKS